MNAQGNQAGLVERARMLLARSMEIGVSPLEGPVGLACELPEPPVDEDAPEDAGAGVAELAPPGADGAGTWPTGTVDGTLSSASARLCSVDPAL